MVDEDDSDYFTTENIDLYNLIDEEKSSSSSTTAAAADVSFHPGDHVWMWCEAAGGNVRYQHHGIVLSACNNNSIKRQLLKIADFTAPDSGTFAIPDSVASGGGSTCNSSHHHRIGMECVLLHIIMSRNGKRKNIIQQERLMLL